VPDDDDLLDRHGPRVVQLLQQRRQSAAVVGDVQAGVVAQLDRRVAEVAPQARAVAGPLRVGAQPP
jgi:hypothetical protein